MFQIIFNFYKFVLMFQIILQLYQFYPITFVSPVLEKINEEKSTVSRNLFKHLVHILRKEVRCRNKT